MISAEKLHSLLPIAFAESNLPLPGKQSGKVRDWYPLASGKRLLVTTDRLSAFDRILACVPYKGQVLNQLAAWWFAATADIIPNHTLSVPDPNALVAQEAEPFTVEPSRLSVYSVPDGAGGPLAWAPPAGTWRIGWIADTQ